MNSIRAALSRLTWRALFVTAFLAESRYRSALLGNWMGTRFYSTQVRAPVGNIDE